MLAADAPARGTGLPPIEVDCSSDGEKTLQPDSAAKPAAPSGLLLQAYEKSLRGAEARGGFGNGEGGSWSPATTSTVRPFLARTWRDSRTCACRARPTS
jgi:hypothetical protein